MLRDIDYIILDAVSHAKLMARVKEFLSEGTMWFITGGIVPVTNNNQVVISYAQSLVKREEFIKNEIVKKKKRK